MYLLKYVLNIFLISSISFIISKNIFLSGNFFPIVTTVQYVPSILTFSSFDSPLKKSKFLILSASRFVWAKGSNSETFPFFCRVTAYNVVV